MTLYSKLRESCGSVRLPGAVAPRLLTAGSPGPWAYGLPTMHRFLAETFFDLLPFQRVDVEVLRVAQQQDSL